MFLGENDSLRNILSVKEKKRILFYYTDTKKLAESGEQTLRKLKWVLHHLETEARVYTVWKSAELTEELRTSIPIDIYREYENIIEIYKASELVIYAEGQKERDSLAWADAYYGDSSGYVFEFLVRNKPILIQNPKVCAEPDLAQMLSMRLLSFVRDGEWIYFSGNEGNGLFRGDLKTGASQFLACFPDEPIHKNQKKLHANCVRYEDKVVFVPGMANHIAVYDLRSELLTSIELPPVEMTDTTKKKFVEAFVYQNYVYFISDRATAIVKLDMNTCEVTALTEWFEMSRADMMFPQEQLFCGDYEIVGDKCYLPCMQSNQVLELDLKTDGMKFHTIGEERTYLSTICYDGTQFWITGGMDCILSWKRETGEVTEHSYPEVFLPGESSFMSSFYRDGKAYLLPGTANMIVAIDTATGVASSHEIENYEYPGKNVGSVSYFRKCEEGITISRFGDNQAAWCSLDWDGVQACYFEYPLIWRTNNSVFLQKPDGYSRETLESAGNYCQLKFLIDSMMKEDDKEEQSAAVLNVGARIYEYTKKSIERKDEGYEA